MRLDEKLFLALLTELMDENPIAVRAVLLILRTEFTDAVPTLAVTLEERPRLLVNLSFLQEHCQSETHVKACILHEFLHVLLGHTERFKRMSPAQNLALDGVINAIIHRTAGSEYSDFFALYYRDEPGLGRLLRPRAGEEGLVRGHQLTQLAWEGYCDGLEPEQAQFEELWDGLYNGRLVSDDILDLARDLEVRSVPGLSTDRQLMGNHDGLDQTNPNLPMPDSLAEALDEAMKEMNGSSIWRMPKARGVGTLLGSVEIAQQNLELTAWRAQTARLLRKCLVPDRKATLTESSPMTYRLPVLTPRDRRAFLRSVWSPILPEAEWLSEAERPLGSANVYLDVSGSMYQEMPQIIQLLWQLKRYLRTPFWAFSDEVEPARIEKGRLVTKSTGGTSMECVLNHLERTRPASAVVITDGYIESVSRERVARLTGVRLIALVTRDGSPSALANAGIEYRQLERFPNG